MYRYCNVCRLGLDPRDTACQLCSEKGGAYKPTDQRGKWVHVLCANWLPEVFCRDSKKKEPFVLTKVNPMRFRLRCSSEHCAKLAFEQDLVNNKFFTGTSHRKGACVQCTVKGCTSAIHPQCLIRKDGKFALHYAQGGACVILCPDHVQEADQEKFNINNGELECRIKLNASVQRIDIASRAVIETYDTLKLAVNAFNVNPELLGRALNGEVAEACGFAWRYTNPVSSNNIPMQGVEQVNLFTGIVEKEFSSLQEAEKVLSSITSNVL